MNQCVVERFSIGREIRRTREMKLCAQGIHRKNVCVRIGCNIRRRAWPVVLLSQVEVVFDLEAVGTAGYTRVFRKLVHVGADVVHAPMSKRGSDIVKDHREGLCSPRGASPEKLWGFIVSRCAAGGAGIHSIDLVIQDHGDGKCAVVGEGCAV